jgi:hypothetical protein
MPSDADSAASTVPDELSRLVAAHPRLFGGTSPAIHSYLMPGWFDLVDKLCTDVETVLGDDTKKFRVLQLKEKFGALRFYYELGKTSDRRVDLVAVSGTLSLRSKTEGATKMDLVRRLVDEAEARSTQVCERCGRAGELRKVSSWLTALCDEHAKQAEESRSKD